MKNELKVYIDCFGCEIRQLDTQRLLDYFQTNNFIICSHVSECDCAVIITCAVSRFTENASLTLIKKVIKEKPLKSKIIIGGCLPSISPELLIELGIDHIFALDNIESLDNYFNNKIRVSISTIKKPNKSFYDKTTSLNNGYSNARNEYDKAKKGYKIVISNGCLGQCTYCMVRKAIGSVKSVPSSEILQQIRYAIKSNEDTVMLRGGDTGAYGIDINSSFPSLLSDILTNTRAIKLFIHDCNINWLINNLSLYETVFNLDEESRSIKAINFPIQSGSDTILQKMNRPYKSVDIVTSLSSIRQKFPWINIGTHIMIGFPGETEIDFQKTMELIEEVKFDFITCFPYSEHRNAISASHTDKISEIVIEKRIRTIKNKYFNLIKVVK